MALLLSHPHKPRQQAAGFTLIEVMIVVGIIAILSAIALPSYRDYILRGQIVDATTGLEATRGRMEQYFQDNRTYANVGAFTAPCNATFGTFTVTCTTQTATTYTLQAVGSGATAGFTFTVNQQNTRTTDGPDGWGDCAGGPRWIVKKGDKC
jgi:prepilin-type N-terminal cleavage/methylation domain-containing protein